MTLGGLPDDAADAPAMFFLKDSQKAALGDAEALDRGTQCGHPIPGRSSRSNRCWSRCSCPCSARDVHGDVFADNITAELLGDAGKFGAQVSRA